MTPIKVRIGRCGYCGEEKALRFMATANLCSRCQDKVAIHSPVLRKRDEVKRCKICEESKTIRFMATLDECLRCLVEQLPKLTEDLFDETEVETSSEAVADRVTEAILRLLYRGDLPPWKQGFAIQPIRPRNAETGRYYSGLNYWITLIAQLENGWNDSRWMTEKQVRRRGGRVKAREDPTEIYFCLPGGIRKDGTSYINIVATHFIYNWEQIEGMPRALELPLEKTFIPLNSAERIATSMPNPPEIQHFRELSHPRYLIRHDVIEMPLPEVYPDKERYYEALFHELAHSTGHPDRLGRFTVEDGTRNLHERGYEELTAEMTAAMLCDIAGIGMATIENAAAYVKSWAEAIRADRGLLLRASSAAEKALKFITKELGNG